ncbi:hypothetical protein Y032_0720g1814 [Ancylostoma ceylanicum]|uniref:Uncharacterized protein n=1 Tax=Ancylostoma ceylanicum TaxID=53326 RepID=A0A016WGH5_9BILA|nr:hypothetical protein Y032_0720g1814 [Ancylostoma ceylanicum]
MRSYHQQCLSPPLSKEYCGIYEPVFTCAERLSEFCYVPVASNAPFDGLIEEHRIALSDFGLGHFHFSSRLSIRGKIYDLLFLASLEERRGHLT